MNQKGVWNPTLRARDLLKVATTWLRKGGRREGGSREWRGQFGTNLVVPSALTDKMPITGFVVGEAPLHFLFNVALCWGCNSLCAFSTLQQGQSSQSWIWDTTMKVKHGAGRVSNIKPQTSWITFKEQHNNQDPGLHENDDAPRFARCIGDVMQASAQELSMTMSYEALKAQSFQRCCSKTFQRGYSKDFLKLLLTSLTVCSGS